MDRMNSYVTADTIRRRREEIGYTQKQLADQIMVSDKAVSKWETGRGLPDISLIEPLAQALRVSVAELLCGQLMENRNRAANMRRSCFYVCPVCGNIIHAVGKGSFSCCGILLPVLEAETAAPGHEIQVEVIETDYFVSLPHPMERSHYISFFAYVTQDTVVLRKLYPEQDAQTRFPIAGPGVILWYCNRHGLFQTRV